MRSSRLKSVVLLDVVRHCLCRRKCCLLCGSRPRREDGSNGEAVVANVAATAASVGDILLATTPFKWQTDDDEVENGANASIVDVVSVRSNSRKGRTRMPKTHDSVEFLAIVIVIFMDFVVLVIDGCALPPRTDGFDNSLFCFACPS